MNRNLKGNYYITIPAHNDGISFKFTLGSWESEELDKDWNTIPNRTCKFGYADTIRLKVDNWEGLDSR
jgi:alpha-glucosidase